MTTYIKEVLVLCSSCGTPTEWDKALGPEPLCTDCWDARSDRDNEVAASKRAYYEAHKDEVAANQRAYREAHKDEVAANRRQVKIRCQ